MDKEQEPQVQLKVRLPQGLRDDLSAAASAQGTSLNREIVDRLERSRHGESLFAEEFGGKKLAAIIEIVGRTMHSIGSSLGTLDPVAVERGWLNSPYSFDQAVRGACEILEVFRPTVGEMPDLSRVPWMERAGQGMAHAVLRGVMDPPRLSVWQERVRGNLGDLIERVGAKVRPLPKGEDT